MQDYMENPEKKCRKDLLQKMLDARDDEARPLSLNALNTEAADFVLAGSHTTSSSLTWIVWRIMKNAEILSKLHQEIDTALAGLPQDQVPSHQKPENLRYFNCVIKEGLRIDTAVPGSTTRYVPPGGATIHNHNLPGHTIVSAQAYSYYRDAAIFPDPNEFRPERWLNETPEMHKLYISFGADGPRKCIGIHLAYMELRVILAALFWRFDLKSVGDCDDGSMEIDEFWLANPLGQRLSIVATERRRSYWG